VPFEHLTPRPFTSGAIQTYAPVAAGVYGLSNSREWIYIGEANDIKSALLDHLRDVSAPLMQREPTGFVFEVCDGGKRLSRQDRLVGEYSPACNRPSSRYPA